MVIFVPSTCQVPKADGRQRHSKSEKFKRKNSAKGIKMRRVALLFTIFSLLLLLLPVTLGENTEPVTTTTPTTEEREVAIEAIPGAQKCGDYMYVYNNIPAQSNGAVQGTGNPCIPGMGPYGMRFQCVEYVQRYYAQIYGVQRVWPVNYAKEMCQKFPAGVKKTTTPGPGDIYVCAGPNSFCGKYGHTAIVMAVNGNNIWVVEQNYHVGGTHTYPRSSAGCFLTHTRGAVPSPKPAPAPAPKPAPKPKPPLTAKCPRLGYYCGNDKIGMPKQNLYYCSGTGVTPRLSTQCSRGCSIEPQGVDDQCVNNPSLRVETNH